MDQDYSQLAALLNSPVYENQVTALMILQGQGIIPEIMQENLSNLNVTIGYRKPNDFLSFIKKDGQWELSFRLGFAKEVDVLEGIEEVKHLVRLEIPLYYIKMENPNELMEKICCLRDLQSLVLGNIYDVEIINIPGEIQNLTKLKKLELRNVCLTEFPLGILTLKNLEIISLTKNKLTEIPNEIVNLDRLKFLNLAENQLTSIPKKLLEMPSLYQLDISKNNFPHWRRRSYRPKKGSFLNLTK